MRWIMITRKLDPTDDRAGFVMRWVTTLAARLDHLDVICQEHTNPVLPDNVHVYSMGKESGVGRVGQARRLIRYLRQLTPHADGVFCHMIPRYVLFAAPWTVVRRKPLLFWYTHRTASWELRLAHLLANRILTASASSYPLTTPKVHITGHGIEPDRFVPSDQENEPPEIVLVARQSASKRQDWLLRAAALAQARGVTGSMHVILVGGPVEHERAYAAKLNALAVDLAPALSVTLAGPLPHAEVAETLRHCAIAVNLSPPGHFDKAALEAMFTGKPTLVTNTDFLPLFGDAAELLYLPAEASDEDLADRLIELLALSPAERQALGQQLRTQTVRAHSLEGLMDGMVALMHEVTRHD